jgi:MSHA biogenesis protein MshJ
MVFAAVLVAVLALSYVMMIEPQLQKQRRTAAAILQKHSEMKAFEAQVTKLIASRASDPDRADRERLAQLRSQLGDLDALIGTEERKFTAPAQMRAVVEGLLGRSRGVALVELKTLATTTLENPKTKDAKPNAAKAERLIYRHGVELTVTGSYLDLLAYVRDLERLPTQLYWGGLELDAGDYPRVSMKLTLYTLSLDRAWLSV